MKAVILFCLLVQAFASRECGENSRFVSCGTACPLTCDNYMDPPKFCVKRCDMGCHCNEGYVKTADGRCVKPEDCPTTSASLESKGCLEEADVGMCRGYFPMYHYDYKTRSCKEFIYGGCGGNGNRFSTEEECMGKCGDVVVFESDSNCDLPLDVGNCMGLSKRYGFVDGQCEIFLYSGCGGNSNNFQTEEECEKHCGKQDSASNVCELQKDTGPCRAHMPRFYFNKETGQCEEFVFGGCLGNMNNFVTKEVCEATCITPI